MRLKYGRGRTPIGNYHLLQEVGRGGMGVVYRARDARNGQTVALKALYPRLSENQDFIRQFWEGYNTLSTLRHPNIVHVSDFGHSNGRYYIAAEYIHGDSLENRLTQGRGVDSTDALKIMRQVANALDYSHGHGIVHCDLKPANILVERTGRVVLTDYDIARILRGGPDAQQSATGALTPEYVSPEQADGHLPIDHRADIYSLGVVAYRLLTGHVPFEREHPAATLYAHVHEAPPPVPSWRPDMPAGVDQVIMRALAKSPDQRPYTAGEFINQLEAALAPSCGRAHLRPVVRQRAFPFLPSLLGIALVTLLGVSAFRLMNHATTGETPSVLERVMYTCQPSGSTALHLCLRQSDGLVREFAINAYDWGPAWAPDGKRVAFVSGSPEDWDIWLLDTERGGASSLIASSGHETVPSWYPDGERLVFDSNRTGQYQIFQYNLSTGELRQLTNDNHSNSDPDVSPNGKRIAFVSDRDGNLEIYTMMSDGRSPLRLTYGAGQDFAPAWSPDGSKIAYECKSDEETVICVVDADGTARRQLTQPGTSSRHPTWSSDGNWIIFSRESTAGIGRDIWRMRPDGSNQQVWIQNGRVNMQPAAHS